MVSSSLSDSTGDGDTGGSVPRITYTEQFEAQLPYYLSIGMTADEYWDGDPDLVIAYRQAEKLRFERKNFELWLQGMYIYEALCDASPLYHDLAKKGTKAHPYADKPYDLRTKDEKAVSQMEEDKQIAEKGERFMTKFMAQFNREFAGRSIAEKQEVKRDGCDD